ncbi:MAG: glycosyltransferase family 4 protein [Proteobacteria bacterium]|nr:glycosyltransferase family 4 protein [Desulfobacteraceae bacterium]MBU4014284.1 glycosyltransferase family 4 protein [Pseudomonadota bacterium]MBU4067910.1 glycosyltransferase family 4 protein [Pseudomonadota bacterium]MBU4103421.1 glycosyltransferase family 4 protein [Patescibacteria group bacterium]
MSIRLKILVLAYACEPNKGSEPEVGWQWVKQLARKHDVWVITRANNKIPIVNSGIFEKFSNLHFVYIDLPTWARFWKKGNRGIHLYYWLWQIVAVTRAWQLHRVNCFNITHHITFSPFYQPPLISLLPIPFIWGPIGAGEKLPRRFFKLFNLRQKMKENIRTIIRLLSPFNPLVFLAFCRAKLILAATKETYSVIPICFRHKAVVESQIGMETVKQIYKIRDPNKPFKIISAGRHVYWKGGILIIRAFYKFVSETGISAELHIISDGPEKTKFIREVNKLKIQDIVTFTNWFPRRDDVFSAYKKADIFAYASLFECGGYVVLEALSVGLPIVCLDLGGPGEIVNKSCGCKVIAKNPEQVVNDLSSVFKALSQDDTLLSSLSAGACSRVNMEFNWDLKGDRLHKLLSDRFSA